MAFMDALGAVSRAHDSASGALPPPGLPDDWSLDLDLPCPRCRYNLRHLRTPRCPECGTVFRWQSLNVWLDLADAPAALVDLFRHGPVSPGSQRLPGALLFAGLLIIALPLWWRLVYVTLSEYLRLERVDAWFLTIATQVISLLLVALVLLQFAAGRHIAWTLFL